jgi:hypothetical protein
MCTDSPASALLQAIRAGRIPPGSRDSWVQLLATDPNAESVLTSIKPNTIPLAAVGYSTDLDDPISDDQLYRELFG